MGLRLTAINGNSQRLDGGAMFGNAPKAMWSKWLQPDEANRIPLSCRALLVQTEEGRNILFEVGVGAFFSPDLKERYGVVEEEHILIEELGKLGLDHQDIDDVFLSHLHFDHCGGVLSAYEEGIEPKLLFPNATFYTGKEQWERAINPHMRDRASYIPFLNRLLEESGRLVLIEKDSPPDLGIPGLRLHSFSGHTPGMLCAEIPTQEGPLVFVADLAPGLSWVHLPITMGYDRMPELVINEKLDFYREMEKRSSFFFFTHDPSVPCARLERNEKGRYCGVPTPLPNC